MRAVVNASPLIYLGKLGRLDLLENIYSEVITTDEVKNEVLTKGFPEFAALKHAFDNWIEIKEVNDREFIKDLQLQVDTGEASVIALVREMDGEYVLILDDFIARAIARTLNIRITGSLGVILEALQTDYLSAGEVRALVDKLITDTPYRISVKLYQDILEKIQSGTR